MTSDNYDVPSRQPDEIEPLDLRDRDVLDFIDETVARITDADVEEHLRKVLGQAAYPRRHPDYDCGEVLAQVGNSQPTIPGGRPTDALAAEAEQDGPEDAGAAGGGTSVGRPSGKAAGEVSALDHAEPAHVADDPDRRTKKAKKKRKKWKKVIAGAGVVAVGAAGAAAVAIAVSRYKRLTDQDEIADAVGAPVLASIPALLPPSPAEWRTLLDGYRYGLAQARQLHKALQELGVIDRPAGGVFLTVLSLSADPGALALGPQLAVYAASFGIKTVLVIGPGPDTKTTVALRAACAAASVDEPGNLRTVNHTAIEDAQREHTAGELTVLVTVVDSDARPVLETIRATTSIAIGVSAGAATAEQLRRLAAVGEDRAVAGVLIANPMTTTRQTDPIVRPAGAFEHRQPNQMSDINAGGRPLNDLPV